MAGTSGAPANGVRTALVREACRVTHGAPQCPRDLPGARERTRRARQYERYFFGVAVAEDGAGLATALWSFFCCLVFAVFFGLLSPIAASLTSRHSGLILEA